VKKALKWVGIGLLALTLLMVGYAVLGLKAATEMNIQGVDLSRIADGTYAGGYESFRWSTDVTVMVADHRITGITPVKTQDGRESIIAELTDAIIAEQRTDVDAVSGATASSNCFLKAVETALENAQEP
jgi:uncharacterized protein with FMN-binding domain